MHLPESVVIVLMRLSIMHSAILAVWEILTDFLLSGCPRALSASLFEGIVLSDSFAN